MKHPRLPCDLWIGTVMVKAGADMQLVQDLIFRQLEWAAFPDSPTVRTALAEARKAEGAAA